MVGVMEGIVVAVVVMELEKALRSS
jgi:hypothetical protein